MATRTHSRPDTRAPGYVQAIRETSLGWIGAVSSRRGLAYFVLPRPTCDDVIAEILSRYGDLPEDESAFAPLFAEVDRYLAGEPAAFDVPLDLAGTQFQREVWAALRRIPYGQTSSYGEVARAIGRPLAMRAVGQAVGSNPVGLIVPCHRVLRAGGLLGGFGGGLPLKRRLLSIEGIVWKEETQ